MNRLVLLSITAASLLGLALSLDSHTASAQQPNGDQGAGQALEIGQLVIPLSADPGQTVKTEIDLRNVSRNDLLVTGSVNDFVAAGEDGTPRILFDNEEESPYSIKTWFGPLPSLKMTPRQIEKLPVTIHVPANAAPGGYYGVIRFSGTPPELEGTGVSLSASLGSLVFLTVNGDAKKSLAIEEFGINRKGKTGTLFESTPLTFYQRLNNNGNIHIQPAGQVTITDMFGKKVANVNVNLPPRNILPGSIRKFEQPFDSSVLGNKKLFGRYTADLKIVYGEEQKVLTSSMTFWVIPYRLIGGGIIALIAGFFALRIMLHRYNQSVIRNAQKSKRK